jgi:hypothetical protein
MLRLLNIGASSVIVLIAFFLVLKASESVGDDVLFFQSALFLYLGIVFLYAYFNEHVLMVSRAINFGSRWLSFPESRHMVVFYPLVFFFCGGWFFYQWLFLADGVGT